MLLADLTNGKIIDYDGGSFLSVERRLGDIETGNMGRYIRKYRDSLFHKNIQKHFPELALIPKNRMLFFDIETSGLSSDSPVISIAMAKVLHQADVHLQCLFARDYIGERAVLKYFLDILPNYEAFFTYNGSTFDLPRLDARVIYNGLFSGIENSLKATLDSGEQKKHYDLYQIGRENGRIRLESASLQKIEKFDFHFERPGDITGDKIPGAYFEYVYGREMRERDIRIQMRVNPRLWEECGQKVEEVLRVKRDDPKFNERVASFYINEYGQQAYVPGDGLWKKCREQAKVDHNLGSRDPQAKNFAEALFSRWGGRTIKKPYPGKRVSRKRTLEDMAKIINHNLLDVASMVAVLTYLNRPAGSPKPYEELGEPADNGVPF